MIDRSLLLTEQRLPHSYGLDRMSAADIVALMNRQDRIAVDAVAAVRHDVTAAVELIVSKFQAGGRLIYVGAGTSGRLGVLDASECPPTFRSDPQQVLGIIAGGEAAMFRAQEGAEDSFEDGQRQVAARDVSAHDVVCGIAAGGTTPFVHGALAEARTRQAATVFITCVAPFTGEPKYDVTIRPLVGPEVLTGSTRLKAGTATKLVLNQLTTAAFVRMGKCYENLMIDMKASNAKLRDRAVRMLAIACDIDADAARRLISEANGHVKTAILMHRAKLSAADAESRLAQAGGHLSRAMNISGR
ncbi:MAG: N-acetylmuramic acid 6-phosphate etherase [Tepidisphaeraceae bacterium]